MSTVCSCGKGSQMQRTKGITSTGQHETLENKGKNRQKSHRLKLRDFTFCLLLVSSLYLALRRKNSKHLPPCSLGFPFIDQSLSFLHASANKFIFTCDANVLGNQQPAPFRKICGERNLTELTSDDHKRVRGAVVSFLKSEMLKQYVGKIDEEVMPVMKTLTFNIMSSLLFGIEQGERRNNLVELIRRMMNALSSLHINLPFTRFNRSLKASAKLRTLIKDLINERRAALEQRIADPTKDLITCFLGIGKNDPLIRMFDEEIVDNVIDVMIVRRPRRDFVEAYDSNRSTPPVFTVVLVVFKEFVVSIRILSSRFQFFILESLVRPSNFVSAAPWVAPTVLTMIAGLDTSSVLINFLVKLLGTDRSVYAKIVQEHEEITKTKTLEELLTLGMNPPLLGSFRKILNEFEYEGNTIPNGWQVIWATNITHMDERIFPDPSKFDPSRFEKQGSIPPYCFVAFGGGARICPGNEFARSETLVTMHYLVTRFDGSSVTRTVPSPECRFQFSGTGC
ncbi:hypothetical protein F3Y22_tig00004111pilonHSYRG00070 [Hibiscus syriacus]|uniref:Uncharacterized protein n=1 Tax=Hibiscus syriacus TaxID=106335 RepID=A0A6A3CNJ8_HIBSY|nr:hypothetical protein F3Y22_tig00004111pilonHSYRG00070 [Hibiscus syriacus]